MNNNSQYQRAVTPTIEGAVLNGTGANINMGGSGVRGKVLNYSNSNNNSVRNRIGISLGGPALPNNSNVSLTSVNTYSLLRGASLNGNLISNPSPRAAGGIAGLGIAAPALGEMAITGRASNVVVQAGGPGASIPSAAGSVGINRQQSFRLTPDNLPVHNPMNSSSLGSGSSGHDTNSPLALLPRYDLELLQEEIPADGIIFARSKTVSSSGDTNNPNNNNNNPPLVIFRTPEERLRNPERLNLDRRNLMRCPVLEQEQRLRLLNFQNNQISAIEHLDTLPNLIFLDFYNNRLTSLQGPLASVRGLRVLMAGKNKISAISNLSALRKLDVLDLHSNEISLIEGLEELSELRVLNLAGNKIPLVGQQQLAALTSLTELNLRRNCISSVAGLEQLPALQRVFLSHNEIKSFGDVACVFNVRYLIELSLDGNPISTTTTAATATITDGDGQVRYRQHLVARILSLKHLDLKRVTEEERAAAIKSDVLLQQREQALLTAERNSLALAARLVGSGHNKMMTMTASSSATSLSDIIGNREKEKEKEGGGEGGGNGQRQGLDMNGDFVLPDVPLSQSLSQSRSTSQPGSPSPVGNHKTLSMAIPESVPEGSDISNNNPKMLVSPTGNRRVTTANGSRRPMNPNAKPTSLSSAGGGTVPGGSFSAAENDEAAATLSTTAMDAVNVAIPLSLSPPANGNIMDSSKAANDGSQSPAKLSTLQQQTGLVPLARAGKLSKAHHSVLDIELLPNDHIHSNNGSEKALVAVGDGWDWSSLLPPTKDSSAPNTTGNGNSNAVANANTRKLLGTVSEALLVHMRREVVLQRFPSTAFLVATLPALRTIRLVGGDIASLKQLEFLPALLASLPVLEHVVVRDCPLAVQSPALLRSFLIAALSTKIKVVNEVEVTEEEREVASKQWQPVLALRQRAIKQFVTANAINISNNNNNGTSSGAMTASQSAGSLPPPRQPPSRLPNNSTNSSSNTGKSSSMILTGSETSPLLEALLRTRRQATGEDGVADVRPSAPPVSSRRNQPAAITAHNNNNNNSILNNNGGIGGTAASKKRFAIDFEAECRAIIIQALREIRGED